jgi:very-short-patch-repair endonuclease
VGDSIDSAIAALASRQHGNITRPQLLALGLGADAICYRVRIGRLHRIFSGVYSVGHRPPSPLARAAAAVLACGPGAVLSHGSAATLWGIDAHWHRPPEVTVTSARRRRGIAIHRSHALATADRTVHFGIAVTSPARTIFDIAPRLSDQSLVRAVNDARLAGHLRLADLSDLKRRHPRNPSTKRLESLVRPTEAPTRSQFEDAFLAFVERYDLPRPEVNQRVAGHEVDMLFRAQKLVVELDGYEYHSDRASFERDRNRDPDLLAAGFGTVRVTWERIQITPANEAARLHSILARAR